MPKAECMKGCNSQACCGFQIQRFDNALFHFVRRFLGEGQCQDALVIDAALHKVNESTRKGCGLAGTRTCQYQLNPPRCRGCGLLCWIEGGHLFHFAGPINQPIIISM